MTTYIIGGGLAGLTTAYQLVRQKQAVTVIDAHSDVGLETSFANGGQLSYSYIDPMASWAMAKKLPQILLGLDQNFTVAPNTINVKSLLWFFQFLKQCSQTKRKHNLKLLANLALRSADLWKQLPPQIISASCYQPSGKLVFYSNQNSFAQAQIMVQHKQNLGIDCQVLTVAQCIEKEPQLQHYGKQIVGGVFSKNDAVANSHHFCQSLNQWLLQSPYYQLKLNTKVQSINTKNGRIQSLMIKQNKNLAVDKLIIAGGYSCFPLLKTLNITLPLLPIKGHSVSVPSKLGMRCSVTDYDNKIVFSQFNSVTRIAGKTRIVAGNDTGINQKDVSQLVALGQTVLPNAGEYEKVVNQWAGVRAVTPNSQPIIGRSQYHNLWLNLGHGFLGLTLALGCAEKVVHSMSR